MPDLRDRLVVALDVESMGKAEKLVDKLLPVVKIFKVGSQLFTACGPEVVKMVGEKGAKVFLDLKWYDIPNIVCLATGTGTNLSFQTVSVRESSAETGMAYPVFMMTVHTQGGKEMLEAAVRGATEKAKELNIKRPLIIGVTVLTSDSDSGSNNENIQKIVLERARFARDAGLDGVVCAVSEARMIRKEFGKDFIIVTAGIRPKDYPGDDQKRISTALEAIEAGADYIVVGRPIIGSHDPRRAAEELLADIR